MKYTPGRNYGCTVAMNVERLRVCMSGYRAWRRMRSW